MVGLTDGHVGFGYGFLNRRFSCRLRNASSSIGMRSVRELDKLFFIEINGESGETRAIIFLK